MITSLGNNTTVVSEKGTPKVLYRIAGNGDNWQLLFSDLTRPAPSDTELSVLASGTKKDCQEALHLLTDAMRHKSQRDTLYHRITRCSAGALGGFIALALLASIARPSVQYQEPPEAMKMQQMQQMMAMQDGLQGLGENAHKAAHQIPDHALSPSISAPAPKNSARVFSFDKMTPMPKSVPYAETEEDTTDNNPVVQTDQYGIPTVKGRSVLNKQANEPDTTGTNFSMIGRDYDNTNALTGVFKDFSGSRSPR